jgi:hypothetical protein
MPLKGRRLLFPPGWDRLRCRWTFRRLSGCIREISSGRLVYISIQDTSEGLEAVTWEFPM